MSRPLLPVVAAIVEANAAFSTEIASRILNLAGNNRIDELERAKFASANLIDSRVARNALLPAYDEVRLEVNTFMKSINAPSMWTAIDVREANPALAAKQLDINTRMGVLSNYLAASGDVMQAATFDLAKRIGKIAAADVTASFPDHQAGQRFVIAYLACGVVMQSVFSDTGIENSQSMLNEIVRWSIAAHGKASGVNFFENSFTGEAVCKALGLKSAKEARAAIYSYATTVPVPATTLTEAPAEETSAPQI